MIINKPIRVLWGVLGLLGWLGLGSGVAQAGVILPVDPITRLPIIGASVTVSIFLNGQDVTDDWLPTPGQTVQIVVNGLANPTLSLVFDPTKAANPVANATLTTSAYPGVCTNFGSDTGPDYTLVGNNLTSNDCGGMAVIVVNPGNLFFIIPADDDFDGMPNIYEAKYCAPGPAAKTCLMPAADIDTGPVSSPLQVGDGIANFDEYRGFIVSGVHVRTNPLIKDLFVLPVNTQCASGTQTSLLGGGAITFVTGNALLGNVNTLISQTQIHPLGYTAGAPNGPPDEWVDNFISLSINAKGVQVFTYNAAGTTADRRINKNALYPVAGNTIQKGLRIIECLDTKFASPVGFAAFGSPNAGNGAATIFTQRIVNFIDGQIAADVNKPLQYRTYQNGAWTAYAPITREALIAVSFEFYLAMEIGHAVRLHSSSSYHTASGSGSNLDIEMQIKADTALKFSIPFLFNSTQQTNFKVKN